MAVVYHAVPSAMVGSVLYPLHELARLSGDAFERQQAKYAGRESVLEARITAAGLRFNDAIHCAPLHPHRLFRIRERMGLLPPPPAVSGDAHWAPGLFFEIPLERIQSHLAYWYRWVTPWINGYPGADVPLMPPLAEFEPFDVTRYRELPEVPPAHGRYLRQVKREGKRPLTFVHVPHVLVAHPIETEGLRVITWETPPNRPSTVQRQSGSRG